MSSTDLTGNEPEDTDSGVEEAILGLENMELYNGDNDINNREFFEDLWIPDPIELPMHGPTITLAEDVPASTIENVMQAPANPPPEAITPNLPADADVIESVVNTDTALKPRAHKPSARQVAVRATCKVRGDKTLKRV